MAWRVKDFADGWVLFHSEIDARREAEGAGNLVQPLYATPPHAQAELDRLRDRVAALEGALSTCAWQLEMLSSEWRAQIPGAIALQCGIKAKVARAALNPQTGEAG